jgi:hypothetical protein
MASCAGLAWRPLARRLASWLGLGSGRRRRRRLLDPALGGDAVGLAGSLGQPLRLGRWLERWLGWLGRLVSAAPHDTFLSDNSKPVAASGRFFMSAALLAPFRERRRAAGQSCCVQPTVP